VTRKFCIWCEMGSEPNGDYLWIHKNCFDELISVRDNIKTVGEYLRGEMPRVTANGNKLGRDTVEDFLVAMADFDRRSRNTRKLIKSMVQGTPLEPLEPSQSALERNGEK